MRLFAAQDNLIPRGFLQPIHALVAMVALNLNGIPGTTQAQIISTELFRPENLIAWCIVPFDAKQRDPEARAQMLQDLGFRKFAYDWRAEHVATFDAEIKALQRHGIEISAWWFPATLDADAREILAALDRADVRTQLWVTLGDPPGDDQEAKVAAACQQLRPILTAAVAQGCTVGLYNHGGWFGEPENQIAVIERLGRANLGIVYNQHHGHGHLDRFPELLKRMRPYLYAVNLNGMTVHGDQLGRKILPLGQGELDLELARAIVTSGYRGPIGILGHTEDDAELRLRDNLDGLRWIVARLHGLSDETSRPVPRTPFPPPVPRDTNTADTPSSLKPPQLESSEPSERTISSEQSSSVRSDLCVPAVPNASLAQAYDPQRASELLRRAESDGNARRGMRVFQSSRFACSTCHQIGNLGGTLGPALTDVARRLTPSEIVEAVLWPSRTVKPDYAVWTFELTQGRIASGFKRGADTGGITLFDPATGKSEYLANDMIASAREAGTLMPEGIAEAMTNEQRRDLIRLLLELGRSAGLENELVLDERPADFETERAPLEPAIHRLWNHSVNRDRVYDYYRKEAFHFRDLQPRHYLLPAFPGLDGGVHGHWGNQNENVWKDPRWQQRERGPVLAGVTHLPDKVIPKGICLRLGEQGELATCFDPETLSYQALWRGGFVTFTDTRHGFLDGLRPAGEPISAPEATDLPTPHTYLGYFRVGNRVIFSYRLGDVEYLDAPWVRNGEFERIVAPRASHPLAALLDDPPLVWPDEIRTVGSLGSQGPYVVDTIPLPFDNPWGALLFVGDHDFLSDGTAFLCTMTGDVWRVSGLDTDLRDIRWKRFASGLHQPLGLVVVRDEVFVLGRDQITRLVDLNRDGEADYYACFSHAFPTSAGGHDFLCGLACDDQGRFYTASSATGLLRVSADGRSVETLATGFRNPDGLGLCPDGAITVPSSEGEWTPASMICLIKPDQLPPPYFGYPGPRNGLFPSLPLVYLPRGLDNSSGGQGVVMDNRFGPLAGQMLHSSFGMGSYFLILRDEVNGQPQGAVVPLAGEFLSGAHRLKSNPHDGHLYVSGMAGWGTYTPDDGCFHRVRYTGQPVQLPTGFHLHANGIVVHFSRPVDAGAFGPPDRQFAQVWNYRYGPGYGSPEFVPSLPEVVGHERLDITGVHVLDSKRLFVEIPDLQPVNQLHLVLQVDAGPPQELFITAHRLDDAFRDFPNFVPREKVISPHPIIADIAALGNETPNPWAQPLDAPATAELVLVAGHNLSYSERTLRAQAGERVRLTLHNPDSVPHNWVLLQPDSLAAVGDLANKLVADPRAALRQHVPRSESVIAYTNLVAPGGSYTIHFHAPNAPGRYPFVCTFPGHWMAMNGELLVE